MNVKDPSYEIKPNNESDLGNHLKFISSRILHWTFLEVDLFHPLIKFFSHEINH